VIGGISQRLLDAGMTEDENTMKTKPKPLIEEHYHIQELIEGQERRTADRNRHRMLAKQKAERGSVIDEAPPKCFKDFYCSDCNEDFVAITVKQVEMDWTNPLQNIAFYKVKHPCGKWCIRYITDGLEDPYWMQSPRVARDRGEHYADLIQPFENNYNLLYGKKNK
jgi:hypothetical protein